MLLSSLWRVVFRYLTQLMHSMPGNTAYDNKLQLTELDLLSESRFSQASLAENYVGLPLFPSKL